MKLINFLSIAFAVITVIITLVFFVWWIFKEPIQFGSEKFDQIKWMQAEQALSKSCKRGDMAYDLEKNILGKGLSRQQVMLMLGRPSFEDGAVIEYDLGKCMSAYHGLRIFFDEKNSLVQSRISSH